jgi:hypothetical protein
MANEVEIVISSKDNSSAGFRSAQQSADKTKKSFSDLGDSTDDLATKSATAYGATGALSSGIELSRMKAVKHAEALGKQATALQATADAAETKLETMKEAAEADGKVTAAEEAQIKTQERIVKSTQDAADAKAKEAEAAMNAATEESKLQTALMGTGLAFDALSGVTDAATLIFKQQIITKVRDTAATITHRTATIASSAATKAATAAQWALNIAMRANPIGLVITAVVALVAAIVIAYKRSETFRAIVQAAGRAAVAAFRSVLNAVNSVISFIRRNWPILLAIITGPIGIAVLLVIRNFERIKSFVSAIPGFFYNVFNRVKGAIVNAVSSAVGWAIGKLESLVNFAGSIPGRVKDAIGSINPFAHGGVTGAAGGGPRSGRVLVGEQGPELVNLPAGSRVIPNGATRQLLGGAGSGGLVQITIDSAGSKMDQLLLEVLRKSIRINGGNVQVVLGSS